MSRAAIVAPNGDILLPCSVCERILPIDDFSPNSSQRSSTRHYRAYKCRHCVSLYWRAKRQKRADAEGRAFRPLTVNPDPRKRHCAGCDQNLPIEQFRVAVKRRRLADGSERVSSERRSRCISCLQDQNAKSRRKRQLRIANDPELARQQLTLDRRSRAKTQAQNRRDIRERTRWVCQQARTILELTEQHGWPHAGIERATGLRFATIVDLARPGREQELLAAIGKRPQSVVKRESEAKLLQFRARLRANDPELIEALRKRTGGRRREAA